MIITIAGAPCSGKSTVGKLLAKKLGFSYFYVGLRLRQMAEAAGVPVHEFYKLEQLVFCEASHELSVKIHEELTRNNEEFIESLGLPYRRLIICAGDLKSAQVKSYDTELWIPSEERYREIGSSS